MRKHGYKTLGAREINSPMFPPSLSANNNIDSTQSCAECSVTNIKSKTYHLEYFFQKSILIKLEIFIMNYIILVINRKIIFACLE